MPLNGSKKLLVPYVSGPLVTCIIEADVPVAIVENAASIVVFHDSFSGNLDYVRTCYLALDAMVFTRQFPLQHPQLILSSLNELLCGELHPYRLQCPREDYVVGAWETELDEAVVKKTVRVHGARRHAKQCLNDFHSVRILRHRSGLDITSAA